ncbi:MULTISPECIES: fumarylacetoacetate hydrolase family protein [unclassified Variovorax]|jgi:5-oxopent-3-ene-1,2,5-tricarboxylate decarboxylase / 2-hydroxyhepta-2,4-diene-1,7-dioate isomerase|uniref:fumarylacetoacetate hydrolase family protein n=1 Tax=unclassified Variovorax TaxID=663243 RepID=UPI00086EC0AD|nr:MULTISPECIES: fumarylacetoacetate hydrolase family protein [unclassified Variovorax]MBN8758487.1 fumarylacetoacetate hydrolase family protein [Variovorax sp.]ODU18857.1 MAG: fumarylacetoacetate hydrolase [Variovorax sp. SCN 67-85]ODV18312.1 MAG: fumarylacetoacetate hydrolase [Variovorax sp. SCN 67-20]OJZ05838.1 MAG: fumarylacetoacetate hydrolase [Variovorax sp. 67-131]
MSGASTFLPRGTVYGTLLNFRREVDAWQPRMDKTPYNAAPKAPVLYVKPANTWTPSGGAIAVPARVPEVEIGATVAAVVGEDGEVAGYVLVNDLSIPHESFYRPPVKFKCLDGFFGLASGLRSAAEAGEPSQFRLTVKTNGAVVQTIDFAEMVRPAARLLADIGEFMTLRDGDWLLLGLDITADGRRPRAQVGDRIEISSPGFAILENSLVAETAA